MAIYSAPTLTETKFQADAGGAAEKVEPLTADFLDFLGEFEQDDAVLDSFVDGEAMSIMPEISTVEGAAHAE